MNSPLSPPSALVEHALELIAAAETEQPDKARSLRGELEAWRAASVEHAAAYEHALRQWQVLGALAPQLREQFSEPCPVRRRRASKIRGTLAAVAFMVCTAAAIAWHVLRLPTFDQAAQTGVAQIAQIDLPDGSHVHLNAKSALQATYYRDRRMMRLAHGEARFDVRSDPARPFRVVTREGTVEVVGTVFVVADRGEAVRVEVERGLVQFKVADPFAAVEVAGGERMAVRGGVPGPVEKLGHREPGSWRNGWLVFDNERLDEALPAINAFRAAPIVIADAHAGALKLTGRFRATDSEGLLAALPRILPVRVTARADGSAEVASR